MKITIATGPWLPVPAVSGGAIPRMWQGLAEEFVRQGHDVCIFARSFAGQPSEEVINNVRYLRRGGAAQSLSIARDLAKDLIYAGSNVWRLPPADILVTNDFWLPVLAGPLARRAGRIVVNANRFPKGQFRLYARVSGVAAASTAVRDAVIREYPPLRPRTSVIPNPVDTTLMRPARGLPRAEVRTILYVGRLHPEKGVHLLVEAFGRVATRHPNLRLRIVGPSATEQGGGGAAYEQTLRSLARELPVDFCAPVFEPHLLAEIYRTADLFCYPSLAEKGESFGVAPLEAMACGVPPVVSRLECFNDFVREGITGWAFDHRAAHPVDALTDKLDEVLNNQAEITATARRANERARDFSYEVVAKRYLAEFASLLTNRSKKDGVFNRLS